MRYDIFNLPNLTLAHRGVSLDRVTDITGLNGADVEWCMGEFGRVDTEDFVVVMAGEHPTMYPAPAA